MKKRRILQTLVFGTVITGALSISIFHSVIRKSFIQTFGDESPYQLSLNSSNRITNSNTFSGSNPISGTVYTTLENPIEISGYNIVKYNNGWQTILPNGYIFNDLDGSTDHNKISGIKSIKYVGNGLLSLHYGYTVNNSSLFYGLEKTLTNDVEYVFDDGDLPSYFYLKNNSATNINIENLSINYSCSAQSFPRNNLNVLMIGNSFADDTIFYAKNIAASYGITLNIFDAYIGGCTINTHYSNMQNDTAAYSMRSTNGTSWVYQDNMTLNQIIDSNTWDYITFQQASAEVGRPDAYNNLEGFVGIVRNRVGPDPKFYWYQTWAYDHDYMEYYDYFSYFNNDQLAMFNATNTCYQNKVAPTNLFEKTIFAGTAVQNMRTSYMQDTISRDGKHMSTGHGRYLLGLNFVSNLLGIDYDLSPCSYFPEGINSSFKNVAYESIRNARRTPFSVTQSVYTQSEMANYDLTNYSEIDVGFVGNSYYDSTDPSKYSQRQGNVSGTSCNFVATKMFAQNTLPIGSLVFCLESFGYRPEAWTSLAQQDNRPSERYDNVLEIDSTFWNGYQYRAFNIFKVTKSTLMGQFEQVFNNFKIFVPNSSLNNDIVLKNTNTYSSSDRAIFASEFLNFDSYDRVFVDPIIGFYKCDDYYNLQNSYVDSTAKKFVCTRAFFTENGELPKDSVIICDSGYQWRSDCWGDHGKTTTRPNNVSTRITRLDETFMNQWRIRTFNFSRTDGDVVGQNEIAFANHVRIYVPNSTNVEIERPDRSNLVTFSGTGTIGIQGAATYVLGNSVNAFFIITGESNESIYVMVAGNDAGATSYEFNKSTNVLTIQTNGEAGGFTYGTITGTYNRDAGTYTNVSINGSIKQYVSNSGSITISDVWRDHCNYSSETAANAVWQRWYGSTWTANSGDGGWTSPNRNYTLENDYSLGLRIAPQSNSRTRFTLKNDLGNGSGMAIKGFVVWLYNPNGSSITGFRIYAYKIPSTMENGHAVPTADTTYYSEVISKGSDYLSEPGWLRIQIGFEATIYNFSLFFQSNSSSASYVYLGHITIY